MSSTLELLYQVTGSRLLSRQIIEQFLIFGELYFAYPQTAAESIKWPSDEIIGKMEELDQIRKSIVDAAKSHRPQVDYWPAIHAVTEKLNDMPIFPEHLKGRLSTIYQKFAKDELAKSPFADRAKPGRRQTSR